MTTVTGAPGERPVPGARSLSASDRDVADEALERGVQVRNEPPTITRARPRRRIGGRLISAFLTGLLLLAGAATLAIGIAVSLSYLHLQTVLTGSMRPTFSPGDVVVTQAVPTSSVRVGDVITFVPPGEKSPVIHRVVSMQDGVVTTRGDANTVNDPWKATLTGTTSYRLVAVVPLIGWLTEIRGTLLLLGGLLLGLSVLLELRKEVRVRKMRSQPQPQA